MVYYYVIAKYLGWIDWEGEGKKGEAVERYGFGFRPLHVLTAYCDDTGYSSLVPSLFIHNFSDYARIHHSCNFLGLLAIEFEFKCYSCEVQVVDFAFSAVLENNRFKSEHYTLFTLVYSFFPLHILST